MFEGLKKWATSTLAKKYAGSAVRSVMLILSGYLLAKGLADKETADAFTQSLGTILLNLINILIDNPDLLGSLGLGAAAQAWSLKEKKDKVLTKKKAK